MLEDSLTKVLWESYFLFIQCLIDRQLVRRVSGFLILCLSYIKLARCNVEQSFPHIILNRVIPLVSDALSPLFRLQKARTCLQVGHSQVLSRYPSQPSWESRFSYPSGQGRWRVYLSTDFFVPIFYDGRSDYSHLFRALHY
ncbi:hypothetical protein FGO68_gene5849 [Halteria grandinella]|uniref:Uncharacterized protein n=1 Tax=Halteria grandinella TaxID=5974 RepID=A0A8J8NFI2_HALGN|nr:hypothetical protein FGO68_gene5849 [Halteria grandinella]